MSHERREKNGRDKCNYYLIEGVHLALKQQKVCGRAIIISKMKGENHMKTNDELMVTIRQMNLDQMEEFLFAVSVLSLFERGLSPNLDLFPRAEQ